MNWHPIELAQKLESTKIDVWVEELTNREPKRYRITDVFWMPDSVQKTYAGGYWATPVLDDKYFVRSRPVENSFLRITHWMPIPDGPTV